MTRIVSQWNREAAMSDAASVVRHQISRVKDELNEAIELLSSESANPDKAVNAINRATNLAGRAQQAAQIWKGLALDWNRNEPKPAEPPAPSLAEGANSLAAARTELVAEKSDAL